MATVAGATEQLLLTLEQAAQRCAMSVKSFRRHVLPHIKVVQVGRMKLVPVAELERWVEESSTLVHH